MKHKITFILFLILSFSVYGKQHYKIDTLGTSKAGQYVALEEYSYKPSTQTYHVTIKILNVWTKKYVGNVVEVEEPAINPEKLLEARAKAKSLAQKDLLRFKISNS